MNNLKNLKFEEAIKHLIMTLLFVICYISFSIQTTFAEPIEVNQSSKDMSNNSSQVNDSANVLNQLSDELKKTVGQFKV